MNNPGKTIDLETWQSADHFRLFRTYDRPHYAITTRVNVSKLMTQKPAISPFRHAIWAIGCGLQASPAMRTRFQSDDIIQYDRIDLSSTVGTEDGDFRYVYLRWQSDRARFDAHAASEISKIRKGQPLNANTGQRDDVAYLSCLPWLDFTALDNALPGPDDCIPRISWGKIVPCGTGFDMAMAVQVHHALVQGADLGVFFAATQEAIDQC